MSADTVMAAIGPRGFGSQQMTSHGFRSMFSTILNESVIWSDNAIEWQQDHVPRNDDVRAVYNYAHFLPERIWMMQWFKDYLGGLMGGKESVII